MVLEGKYELSIPSLRGNPFDGRPIESSRVNEIVGKYIENFELDAENTLIYACGHPGMIEDVKEKWIPNGFKVDEERFWKED